MRGEAIEVSARQLLRYLTDFLFDDAQSVDKVPVGYASVAFNPAQVAGDRLIAGYELRQMLTKQRPHVARDLFFGAESGKLRRQCLQPLPDPVEVWHGSHG